MKKNVVTMVLGILFGLGLVYVTYLYLFLGIALALTNGIEWFIYLIYVFPILALVAIIGSCFALKNIKVTRIMLLIPLIAYLATSIYTFVAGLFSINYLFSTIAIFALGLIAVILTFIKTKEQNRVVIDPNSVEMEKEKLTIEENKENEY